VHSWRKCSPGARQSASQTSQSVPLFERVTLHCGNQVSRAGSRQAKWDNTFNQPTTCLRLSYAYNYVVLFQSESANVVNECSTDTKNNTTKVQASGKKDSQPKSRYWHCWFISYQPVQYSLCLHYMTGSNNMNLRKTRPTVLSNILPLCLFWCTTILQYVRPRVHGHYILNVLPFQNNRTMASTTKISENNITSTQ
jgi:hypothetical protein